MILLFYKLILKKKKGPVANAQQIPSSGLYIRKLINCSRASIFMLRQCHSFPYKGILYISLFNSARKTNYIFISIKYFNFLI